MYALLRAVRALAGDCAVSTVQARSSVQLQVLAPTAQPATMK
jgi:hypothetical protein